MPAAMAERDPQTHNVAFERFLAWYFVTVWGSGYLATKVGLQYAPPFTFLSLRFAFGLFCLALLVAVTRPSFPKSRRELGHLAAAGALMHAANLGGSHYAQYLGMSAGVVALILALQPLVTAAIAARWMREVLSSAQWLGVVLGLAGVALVVWYKIDVQAITWGSLAAVLISLAAITAGTLYQRIVLPGADLWAGALVQFAVTLAILAPLAATVEGFQVRWAWPLAGSIAFLVILASIFAVNALHTLMRRGAATRVTSLLYLTPLIAVALEYVMFGVEPGLLTLAGVVVTCVGVALVSWRKR
jgi:drug/metabolite transporter (DMT)-like permease